MIVEFMLRRTVKGNGKLLKYILGLELVKKLYQILAKAEELAIQRHFWNQISVKTGKLFIIN